MIASALLRWRGLAPDASLEQLAAMRAQMRDGVAPRHLAWGDALVAGPTDAP